MTAIVERPRCRYCHAPEGGPSHRYGESKCCPDCDHRPRCWTCGIEMDPTVWQAAPRDPEPYHYLRTCEDCHYFIEFALPAGTQLRVMNMVRYAANVATVAPLDSGSSEETDQ